MPNFAVALKQEIARLARKEVKSQTSGTQKSVTQYRRELNNLKRELKQQARKLSQLQAQLGQGSTVPASEPSPTDDSRFSARSVRAQRSRLSLSRKDYGTLVGVTGLTIYNWEHGKSRPRESQFAKLISLRGIGKREALARLESMNGEH